MDIEVTAKWLHATVQAASALVVDDVAFFHLHFMQPERFTISMSTGYSHYDGIRDHRLDIVTYLPAKSYISTFQGLRMAPWATLMISDAACVCTRSTCVSRRAPSS